MKMEGKRPRGRPKLRWKDTIRRDMKAWKIKEEWATDRENGKVSARPATPNREMAAKGEKEERNLRINEILNEFNRAAISLLLHGSPRLGRCQAIIPGIRRR